MVPVSERPSIAKLAERDGWVCHICERDIDPSLHHNHKEGATIDHVVPLAAGGDDSMANTALAHRTCNSAKGVGGTSQLRLIG